jgi:hypothetical protein
MVFMVLDIPTNLYYGIWTILNNVFVVANKPNAKRNKTVA